jgi:hypothetical protein
VNRCSAGQRIDYREKQMNVNAPGYDVGRIRCDDQELIIRNCYLTARADLRTSPGKHLGLSPASTPAVSPSRRPVSGQLALPGQAR